MQEIVPQKTENHLPGHTSDDPEMRLLAAREHLRRQLREACETALDQAFEGKEHAHAIALQLSMAATRIIKNFQSET